MNFVQNKMQTVYDNIMCGNELSCNGKEARICDQQILYLQKKFYKSRLMIKHKYQYLPPRKICRYLGGKLEITGSRWLLIKQQN